ncbi:tryptophan--tRNA ligase [Vanrija albida]|uniref:tryptophan--tRNA ligase n=1 Tax=Vanrija albida TaxID=181172 RepID=A0ABR3PUX9_9TREE
MSPASDAEAQLASGQLTPSTIAKQLSQLDLPAPSNLHLASSKQAGAGGKADLQETLSGLNLPEPEAVTRAQAHRRSESQSQDLAEKLSRMNLPQPERIFGPNDGNAGATESHKKGVTADDWAKVKLDDEVPEAVRSPTEMHFRRASVAKSPTSAAPAAGAAAAAAPVAAAAATSAASGKAVEQKITPFDVQGGVDADGKETGIDYDKLADRFGAQKINPALLERFERVTGRKPHPLMRRGTFYTHREFDKILDRYEKGEPFYLYTGRGPSSDSMHMGHLIPFLFTAWLQDVFGCPCVIQVTDDEKYLLDRDAKKQQALVKKNPQDKRRPYDILEKYKEMGQANIADIIACGFKLDKTFIFSDLDYVGKEFYRNIVLMAKTITVTNSKGVFGFADSDNVGMLHFAAVQSTPSFCNSFPQIFGERTDIPCLIPCAIDQDPYFLVCRESADRLKYKKPALIHAKFLPALQGAGTKMSASNPNSNITLTDKPNEIKNKIRKHAFSGGGATQELHKEHGGNPDVDIAYLYLSYFEEDDEKMARLAAEYRAGTLSTVQMKDECIAKLQEVVSSFQERHAAVTPELVKQYQDPTRKIDPTPRAKTAAA